ncbi:MAG: D-sedoheptulose-7-phosphate isomerase [Candidatus Limnocylindrales bacterium]
MTSAVDDLIARLPALQETGESIELAIEIATTSLRSGGKLLVCGNGGSAADAEHLVADLMKAFLLARPIPEADAERLRALDGERGADIARHLQGSLAAISLASDGALISAIANDVRFDMVFAQQVAGLGRPPDILVAISTTGNSPNVINAAVVARLRGVGVIALTGRDGGDLAPFADVAIRVPADTVFEIQEFQQSVYHALARALEERFFGTGEASSRWQIPA